MTPQTSETKNKPEPEISGAEASEPKDSAETLKPLHECDDLD